MENSFAGFCRTLRKRTGLSQKQLAEKAVLSLRTVVYWETGEREPRSDELQRALKVMGASESEMEHAYLLQTSRRGITMARRHMIENVDAEGHDGLIPDLGDLLMAIRMRQGWSPERLAQEMAVNRSTIVRWERTEQLPSEENLSRLCSLLHVYPAERHALLTRRLLPPLWQRQVSLDLCAYRIQRFCDSVDGLYTPLIDLHALTLKREIYLTARCSPHFAVLIARVETFRGKWLQLQDRVAEASACAEHALNLVADRQAACDFLHTTLNLAAYCVGAKQADGAEKSLSLLRRWQSSIPHPEVRLMLCCDMAYYAAQAGHYNTAMRVLRAVKGMIAGNPALESRSTYYNTTYARVLARGGHPYEALNMLPSVVAPGAQEIFHHYLRASMFLDAGEGTEARQCIENVYTKLERHPSRLFQQLTDQLAARL